MQRSLAHAEVSIDEMAAELGVSRQSVSRWLNERGGQPRIGYLKLWALRTGVPLEWLLGEGAETQRFPGVDRKLIVSGEGFRKGPRTTPPDRGAGMAAAA